MFIRVVAIALAVTSLAPALAAAQGSTQNPVSSALKQDLQRAERNFTASAESMPADKWSFKPTPAQMSWGQLMLHVAQSNEYMCATIAGQKMPTEPKLEATASKAEISARLKKSFEYCSTTLGSVSDSGLGEMVPYFGGRQISRAGAMMGLAGDWADHYSAAAIYLRLNGILPPTAKRGEGN